jgi:cysteinyl-tRNA synthetase
VHNGFVDMGAEKMSKSLGNIITPAELLAQGHRGETLRLALLSAHYRSPLPWTEALIEQSKNMLDRLYRAAGDASAAEVDDGVLDALRDDLNTPLALTRLMALEDGSAVKASAALLGLLQTSAEEWFRGGVDEDAVEARIAERAEAKKNRDFAGADRIRDELRADGIVLEDGSSGTTWRRE